MGVQYWAGHVTGVSLAVKILSFQNNWKIALELMLVSGLHAQFFLIIMPAV